MFTLPSLPLIRGAIFTYSGIGLQPGNITSTVSSRNPRKSSKHKPWNSLTKRITYYFSSKLRLWFMRTWSMTIVSYFLLTEVKCVNIFTLIMFFAKIRRTRFAHAFAHHLRVNANPRHTNILRFSQVDYSYQPKHHQFLILSICFKTARRNNLRLYYVSRVAECKKFCHRSLFT